MISKGCVRPNFHRWSLQALAESTKVSSSTSLFLLDCIVSRLEYQHDVIQDLLRWSSQEGDQKHAIRGLETLAYIHKDTCRLGKDLLEHQTIWKRSSTADRHLVHSTFLEIRARHANTVEASVEVLGHWREQLHQEQAGGGETLASSPSQTEHLEQYILLHESIEDFLRRRLGIQLLCDHHVELHERSRSIVTVDAPIQSFVEQAVTEARHIVDAHLHVHPDVTIYGQGASGAVIRPWLHHSMVEILKNAMAAVVQQSKATTTTSETPLLPPIAIHIDQDDTGISIDVIDRGTGIEKEDHILGLGHSSSGHNKRWDRLDEQQSYAAVRSPLSSLGVGLKVARYHVQHFGGRLDVVNNNDGGNGCTASIVLPTDESLLEEIPLHNWLSDQEAEPYKSTSAD